MCRKFRHRQFRPDSCHNSKDFPPEQLLFSLDRAHQDGHRMREGAFRTELKRLDGIPYRAAFSENDVFEISMEDYIGGAVRVQGIVRTGRQI